MSQKLDGLKKFIIAALGIITLAVVGLLDGAFGWQVATEVYWSIMAATGTQNVGQTILDLVRRKPTTPAPGATGDPS